MKNIYIYTALFLMIGICSFTSCSKDELSENTTLSVSRAFSPTALVATVVNKTGARLNWAKVDNASSYTIEVYNNTGFGAPIKAVATVTFDQVPYTITGLEANTQYSIRVKAIGEGVEDSKWSTVTLKTDAL